MSDSTVHQLSVKYVDLHRGFDERDDLIQKRIEMREQQIARLQKKLKRNEGTRPSWIECLVKPIAEQLIDLFPGYTYEISGPFGMNSRTSIWFNPGKTTSESSYYITFVPGNLDNGELMIEDSETDTGQFPSGSMGELNGDNHPHIPIPNTMKIEELLKWVK